MQTSSSKKMKATVAQIGFDGDITITVNEASTSMSIHEKLRSYKMC